MLTLVQTGAITFVSKCWSGCVSDEHLSVQSDFLHQLIHGDLVIADQAFDIVDELPYNGYFSNSFIYENFENFGPFSKINFRNLVTKWWTFPVSIRHLSSSPTTLLHNYVLIECLFYSQTPPFTGHKNLFIGLESTIKYIRKLH